MSWVAGENGRRKEGRSRGPIEASQSASAHCDDSLFSPEALTRAPFSKDRGLMDKCSIDRSIDNVCLYLENTCRMSGTFP